MLLEVLDWLTEQNATQGSEYYHCLALDRVAAMGQSCGGAQVLGVAYDPRIKTCVMLNSGIGDMEMMGTTKDNLKNLHTPMFYMIGGPGDIAYANAQKDYERSQRHLLREVWWQLRQGRGEVARLAVERSGGTVCLVPR